MSYTNRAVQPQKMAGGLKIQILEVEGLYYLGSENKDADQLCSHCAADLRFCFRICKKRFSHDAAHLFILHTVIFKHHIYEPRYEKTSFLLMRKQRCRSAAQ